MDNNCPCEAIGQGTTPDLEFRIPIDFESIDKLWLTFAQADEELFTLEKSSCSGNGNVFTVKLSQEQTLMLNDQKTTQIQMRAKTYEGEALLSNVVRKPTLKAIKKGVL